VKRAAWLALALAPALAAQTVTVTGTVTNAITHEPVVGADLQFLGGRNNYQVKTDAAGAFRVQEAGPGTYRVVAMAREFSEGRVTMQIDGGHDPAPLHLPLVPWPGLSGRVLDAERQPVGHVLVQATHRVRGDLTATTDEAGRFVFRRLAPGEYVLLATPPAAQDAAAPTETAPTFFPNATARAQATVFVLSPGNDLTAYDIVLQSVPVMRVSGRVLDEGGKPAAGAMVQISSVTKKATAGEDGTFEFPRVRRGDAQLRADLTRDGVALRGFADAMVTNHDVEGITLRLSPPTPMTGTVELDGKPALSVEGDARLESVDTHAPAPSAEFKDGDIRFERVYPGRYRLIVEPGWTFGRHYLDAVWLGGRDITLDEIEVAPGMPPFRVVLKTGGGSVRGSVPNGDGGMIVLVPREERMRVPGFIVVSFFRGTQFEVDGVRPGDYYAFAVKEGNLNISDLQDTAYARLLLEGSPSVKVEENSTATLTLLYVKVPSSQ
jgi:hypothetical protein